MDLFKKFQQFRLSSSNESFKVVVLIGIYLCSFFLLTKTIYGIRAYDVFVYGPSQIRKNIVTACFLQSLYKFLKRPEKKNLLCLTQMRNV